MSCDEVKNELAFLLYDELSFEREDAVQRHLEACADCRWELEREKALHAALDRAEVAPAADLLARCRRDLRERLTKQARPSRLAQLWADLARAMAMPWLKPVGAVGLVAAGFFAAQFVQGPGLLRRGAEPLAVEPVASQVRYLQPDPSSGSVRIVLDETRQRVLTGSLDDAAIQSLLVSAVRKSSDPGLRLVSMDILKNRAQSAEVRSALLQAVQTDPIAGVRLKAIEGLTSFAGDAETREVLAKVLLTDDNPGVRIQAIDLLTQHREARIAGVLQELLDRENNNYVRMRCQKALRDMNASVETF